MDTLQTEFFLPAGFDSVRDFVRELIERQTMIVLEAASNDAQSMIRLLHLVIQGKDRTLIEHEHFPLGFQDGIEWYERNDASKDITVDAVGDFLDRSLVDDVSSSTHLPSFPYRVGFTWGWLFALIISGNVLHTQEVVVSTLAPASASVVVGPPVDNHSPRERRDAKRRTPDAQRLIAAPGRRSVRDREEM